MLRIGEAPRGRTRRAPQRSLASSNQGRITAVMLLALALGSPAGCGDPGGLPPIDGSSTPLPGGNALVFAGSAAASAQRDRLEAIVRETLGQARARISLDRTTIVIQYGSGGGLIPQLGFGGRADAETVVMTIDPESPEWSTSIDTEFARVLLHEFHHVARFRAVGFNANLLDAMVAEGLADQFTVEVAGGPPPIWATALQGETLGTWLEAARTSWLESDYDHAAWFFIGGSTTIPTWAGYSVGFEITRRFLADQSTERPSTLVGRSSLDFIPTAAP